MYYRPETNQVFKTLEEVRSGMLFVLFPEDIDQGMLEYNGVFTVVAEPPKVTGGQVAREVAIENIEGKWVMRYEVQDMSPDEIEAAKPPVPEKVTRRQARSALLLRGLLDEVDLVIATIPDVAHRRLAQIEWQDASEFDRNRALVVQIGTALGLDSKGLDDVFRLANTL